MAALSDAFAQMLVLGLITFVGYLAARVGFLDVATRDRLTKLLLNITLPAMIISTAAGLDAAAIMPQVPLALGLGAAQFFALLATGWLIVVLLRVPAVERPTYLFMSVLTNASFIGIPVVAALYGRASVLLTSVFIMGMDVFFFSIGLALLATPDSGSGLSWRSFVSMPMLACLVALLLVFAGWQLPGFLQITTEMLGAVTAPVAMMLIGVAMTSLSARDVLSEWRLYVFILIHQLIVPLACFWALVQLVDNRLLVSMFTIMFAMPVGSMAAAFVGASGRDPRLAGKGTLLSTAASFPLIPLLVWGMDLLSAG